MLSQAGRSYEKTRVVSPYRTRQRFRYYQLDPVESQRKLPKPYQTLQTNLRLKNDSYLLRYAKDITLNTDHHVDYSPIEHSPPRPLFAKAAVKRYIGPIRDEDYSKPLQQNCDHRCAHANNIPFSLPVPDQEQIDEGLNPELALESLKSSQKNSIDLNAHSLLSSKRLDLSQLRSTEPSVIKKRSLATISFEDKPKQADNKDKIGKIRGVSFDSSVGHRYLKEVEDRQRMPEFYEIQKANESIIRPSMRQPHIDVQFPKFRNSISTRYDRADPNWHLTIDTSNKPIPPKDLSYSFEAYSPRQQMAVQSKYPYRQCMNLHIFPK